MSKIVTTGLAALALTWSIAAEAAPKVVTRTVRGIQYISATAWDNELLGQPLARFPLGCELTPGACKFTVWLDFLPGSTADPDTCHDNPDIPGFDCNPAAQCVAWVEFSPSIMPLTDHRQTNPVTGLPSDHDILLIAFEDGLPMRNTAFSFAGSDSFHGRNYELLWVLGGEIEIHEEGLCRVGVTLAYHVSSKAVFGQGLLIPR